MLRCNVSTVFKRFLQPLILFEYHQHYCQEHRHNPHDMPKAVRVIDERHIVHGVHAESSG